MKKRLFMMFMAGVVSVSVCACGGKAEDAANATQEAAATEITEGAASTQETEEVKVSEREDYVALEDVEIEKYVTIPDYTSMVVKAVKPDVTDERIESYINREMLAFYPVTDRAVENGDAVLIDYVGKKDDVAFEGGTAEGYTLNIGTGTFIPGFEEGLIGVMPGETVDLDLTFPADYPSADLAGAEVVFTVTVREIQVSTDYETVTQEQLSSLGYVSKEEVWKEATKVLEESAQLSYESSIANAIMEKLWKESKVISVPEHFVEEEMQNVKAQLNSYYVMNGGTNLEDALTSQGMTMEDFYSQVRPSCEENVKIYLIMEAIARAEDITITDEMIYEAAEQDILRNGIGSVEEYMESVGKSAIRNRVVSNMAMENLIEKVTVETISEEQAMAEAAAEAATQTEE
ncbi:MAG: trigger factor [Lachnospiraceae bacterium]|nr:trigger factor [Lachnospiraceae bacterium]